MPTGSEVGPWDVTNEEYHKDRKWLSHSRLEYFIKSPKLFRKWSIGEWEQEPTLAMNLGSALDCMLTSKSSFSDRFENLEFSSRNTKAYKEWAVANPKKIGLLPDDQRRIGGMFAAVQCEPMAMKLLQSGAKQQAYRFLDKPTGIPCKLMCDIFKPQIITDIKSTREPAEDSWCKDAALFGYHRQPAFYIRGLRTLRLVTKPAFLYIVVGSEEPFDCYVRQLDEDAIELGEMQIGEALAAFAQCKETGIWQTKNHGKVSKISLPAWYMRKEGF